MTPPDEEQARLISAHAEEVQRIAAHLTNYARDIYAITDRLYNVERSRWYENQIEAIMAAGGELQEVARVLQSMASLLIPQEPDVSDVKFPF